MNCIKNSRTKNEQGSSISPYGRVAETLIDNGYCPIPIIAGTKRPAVNKWSGLGRAYFQSSNTMVRYWCKSDYGVGIRLGDGLFAVDVDTKDHEIITAIKEVLDQYGGVTVRRFGNKGFAQFVRIPIELTLPYKIFLNGELICDLLGDGRQCVLPPSIHPNTGQPYSYTSDHTLEDCHIDELPIIDDGFLDSLMSALSSLGELSFKTTPTTIERDSGSREAYDGDLYGWINNLAMNNFGAWVRDLQGLANLQARGAGYAGVAIWRDSGTGQPTEKRKRNLSISPLGIKDFGTDETFSPIDLVMRSEGVDEDGATDWLWDCVGWETEPFVFPELGITREEVRELPQVTVEDGRASLEAFFAECA